MAVVGIQTLIIQELIMCYFKDFQKLKFSRILASLATDTAAQPSHIISVNNLDFRSSFLPTSSGLEQALNYNSYV